MKVWTVLAALAALASAVLGAAFIATRAAATSSSATAALVLDARNPKPESARAAASAERAPEPVTPESLAVAEPATPVSFRQTSTFGGAVVYVPDGCQGPYDVIVHFHGAHPYVKDLIQKAQLRAVVAVYNVGIGAERYAQVFQGAGMLTAILRQVAAAAAPFCGGAAAKPGRVALMAWSAGYGAVEKLLTRAEDRERVDAVLLADGLHAGFMDRYKRQFAPNALQAFRDFGAAAIAKQKLFGITHSAIETDGYGSTTECSRLLLGALGVPIEGARVSGKSGDFWIEGGDGMDKSAHIAQFRRMDTSLLSKLRERWQH
jgi:hypothetical protein